ncbi:hypothetical protein F4860DRAFT_463274 [Xylaria cubensis]|nr:hypothetical protein F4860DRAFT_463274 [Xylaria cubensis]
MFSYNHRTTNLSFPNAEQLITFPAKMSTAKGTVTHPSANRVIFMFMLQYTFIAIVNPSIQPLTANNLTLTYSDVDDLTTTRSFSGRIGTNDLQLKWDNGPKVTGTLNVPGLSPASTVNCSGAWEQN